MTTKGRFFVTSKVRKIKGSTNDTRIFRPSSHLNDLVLYRQGTARGSEMTPFWIGFVVGFAVGVTLTMSANWLDSIRAKIFGGRVDTVRYAAGENRVSEMKVRRER